MGPVRGYKRRKKIEQNASASSDNNDDSVDWWTHFSKRFNGILSSSKGLCKFESVLKVSRKTFDYICTLVKDDMMVKTGSFVFNNGKPLCLNDRVAVALRRLTSGDSLLAIGEALGLSHSTVSQLTWRFVEAIEERAIHHLQWPATESEMTKIKSKFEKIQGLPNCCGAIDSTHVLMLLPTADPTFNLWHDSKENYSMILQAIVDSNMKFIDVVSGYPGKMKESSVLKKSNFFKLCEKVERLNGKTTICSQEYSEVRDYIVGDSGYPLLPWLITPYQDKNLSELETEFNRRHSAMRMTASRALARLKEKWKIIDGVMWRPDKHRLPRIILVCCILHNIIIDMEDEVEYEGEDDKTVSHVHDPGYQKQVCEFIDKNGWIQRAKLSLYLSAKLPP